MKRIRYKCVCDNRKWKTSTNEGDWKRNKYCENNVSMESERMEDVVWESLANILKTSHQEKEKYKDLTLSSLKKGSFKEKERKSLDREIVKIQNTIKRLDSAIVKNEKDKVINPSKAKSIEKLNSELESAKNGELLKLQNKENERTFLDNDSIWIDWVKGYSKKLKKLDNLDRKDRNKEILKYIDKINVSFNEDKRTHNINLKLKLPLIGDELEYINKNKKSDGYKISDGSYEQNIDLPTFAHNLGKK